MYNVILGVTGSIAAYKAADIIYYMTNASFNVNVIMTKSATEFITPLTLQTLSKNKVYIDIFQEDCPSEVKHITLAKEADLLLVAPATANIIGKLSNGIADDMLTATFLAVKDIPILIAPAMNTRMYNHPILKENIDRLVKNGVSIIKPRESMLACGDLGEGALADEQEILRCVTESLKIKN